MLLFIRKDGLIWKNLNNILKFNDLVATFFINLALFIRKDGLIWKNLNNIL